VILLDTSGLLAALDASQRSHRQAADALRQARPPLLLSPFVLAELDYLLGKYAGSRAQDALLEEVARGAYQLEPFAAADIAAARRISGRYHDLSIGLADASIVVLGERYQTSDVLTLDERHFRAITGPGNRLFRLLPADGPLAT
jgi:predicted nucleic acid-binding protein